MNLPRRRMLATLAHASLLATALAATPLARADHDDHDRARRAVLAGEVLPLSVVIEQLERTQGGRVLEAELERSHGRWIYEVTVLHDDGRLVRHEIDARDGSVKRDRDSRDDGDKGRKRRGRGRDR
ncbi:MAG: PepSY domain-containing protein [Burkholderiaceae bacterium]